MRTNQNKDTNKDIRNIREATLSDFIIITKLCSDQAWEDKDGSIILSYELAERYNLNSNCGMLSIKQYQRRLLDPNSFFYVIESIDSKGVVGFLLGESIESGGKFCWEERCVYGYILKLEILKSERDLELDTLLLNEFDRWIRSEGVVRNKKYFLAN